MTLIYPGSFDPVTLGHIDMALRGAKIANRLIVAVLVNPNKTSLFSIEERVALLQGELGEISNIEIDSFTGMLAEYAKIKQATAILRGLRGSSDYESEARYAIYNRMLSAETGLNNGSDGIETMYLPASPVYSFVSSSAVREMAPLIYSGNLSDAPLNNMVSKRVKSALQKHFNC